MALWVGLSLHFRELGEPESCLHPSESGLELWRDLDLEQTCIWNGLRGGLIIPTWAMDVEGLQGDGLIATWKERGADTSVMKGGQYLAYELAGMFAFSQKTDDSVRDDLRERVRFLIEDAPALAGSIDPEGEIRMNDLGKLYRESLKGNNTIQVLARCGRGLAQAPVQAIVSSTGAGPIIISQAITQGRLMKDFGHNDIPTGNPLYDIRPDPAAQQWVLNLLRYDTYL